MTAADELLAEEEAVKIAALIAIETATVPVTRGSDEFDLDEFLAARLSDDTDMPVLEDDDDAEEDEYATADDDPRTVAVVSTRVPFTELKPITIVINAGREQPLRKALATWSLDEIKVSTKFEVDKQIRIGCLDSKIFDEEDLPANCAKVRANAVFKKKVSNDKFSCRITADGRLVPFDPSLVDSTATSSSPDCDKFFQIAFMQAYCKEHNLEFHMSAFDVVGGFLRVKRLSKFPLFLFFPHNFPLAEYAGKYLQVFGAIYGLNESNRLFAIEMDRVMIKASYVKAGSSPGTYVKRSATGKGLCIAVTHVDDVRGIACDPVLIDDLRVGLKDRFQEITEEENCTQYAGITISVDSVSRAVKCSQPKYIDNVALRTGITHLPANIDTPCSADFFEPSISVDDCKPVDSSQYMKLTGSLVHTLSTRDEIRHLVSFLCSKNSTPDAGDFAKAIHVLRYLYSTRDLGRV